MAPCRLSARTSLTGSGPRAAITEAPSSPRPQSLHERLDEALQGHITRFRSRGSDHARTESSNLAFRCLFGFRPRPAASHARAGPVPPVPPSARPPPLCSLSCRLGPARLLSEALPEDPGWDGWSTRRLSAPCSSGPEPLVAPARVAHTRICTPILAASSVPFSLPRRPPRGCVRSGTVDRFAAAPILLLADTAL